MRSSLVSLWFFPLALGVSGTGCTPAQSDGYGYDPDASTDDGAVSDVPNSDAVVRRDVLTRDVVTRDTGARVDVVTRDTGVFRDTGVAVDTGVVMPGMDSGACTGLCGCADNGPPDFSGEGSGRPSASSSAAQRAALVRANHWRTAIGLPAINANASLERSSSAHSTFMASNPSRCWPGEHYETAGCAGYTGNSPFDRMTAAGYSWSSASETIDQENTPEAAVDGWIWTVYHRMPFTNAVYPDTGFGTAVGGGSTYNTEDFGAPLRGGSPRPSTVLVFPPAGTTGVPREFRGDLEGPTPPAPTSTGSWPSGPVISMDFPSMNFTVTAHQLYDGSCNPVAHSYFDASNDPNTQMLGATYAYMYADQPLTAGVTYTAEVTATVDGAPYHHAWRFTVGE